MPMSYEELIHEALTTSFEGWDFAIFDGRVTDDGTVPWDYASIVRDRLPKATALLDLGTGGGELLASLTPLPPRTAATETYSPNLPVARARLQPLGIEVTENPREFPDAAFDLITNRHESYDPREVRRLLAEGGTYLTQQVAGRDLEELNTALGGPPHVDATWDLATATTALEEAGLELTWSREATFTTTFHDIGALVLFLRVISWQIPDFDAHTYEDRLRALHADMERGHVLQATAHRFALTAE